MLINKSYCTFPQICLLQRESINRNQISSKFKTYFKLFNIIKITLLFLPAVILFSCTATDGTNNNIQLILIGDIKKRVNSNSEMIENLEASGTISIDSPELTNSGSIDIKLKKPDSIYVKIEGPFGISVASALIARNEFIYYNAQENVVISGPTNENNIGAILKIKVTFDDLMNSLSGSYTFNSQNEDSIFALIENQNYIILEDEGLFKIKYFIEPESYNLTGYNILDKKNKKLLEVNYNKYNSEKTSKGWVNFPGNIKIYNPEKKQRIWLDYDSKTINKTNLRFNIKVPKSAKVVKWD